MKKKVLILGSGGMAGHIIKYYFDAQNKYLVFDTVRGEVPFLPTYQCDVTNTDLLESIISYLKPDYIINCIGVLNKDAEDNPDKAIFLNSYFPHYLAKIGILVGSKVIHISTDCVFSGKKGAYVESDVKDGIGFYAQSKALGEITQHNALTIRTSIIGPELKENGIGLFDWFMKQKQPIKGYSKAIWTGVSTITLARAIEAAIQQNLSGLYHLVNNHTINKFELLSLFNQHFNRHLTIEDYPHYSVNKSLIRTRDDFDFHVGTYDEMVQEIKDWISGHSNLYSANYIA